MSEIDIVSQCWDTLQEYIPAKEKQIAADHFVQMVVDLDLPDGDFVKLVKADEHLEEAAAEYLDNESEYEEDEW